MPKRISDQKLSYYREKIRRIEQKENKKFRRVRVIMSDSSDSEENASKC